MRLARMELFPVIDGDYYVDTWIYVFALNFVGRYQGAVFYANYQKSGLLKMELKKTGIMGSSNDALVEARRLAKQFVNVCEDDTRKKGNIKGEANKQTEMNNLADLKSLKRKR